MLNPPYVPHLVAEITNRETQDSTTHVLAMRFCQLMAIIGLAWEFPQCQTDPNYDPSAKTTTSTSGPSIIVQYPNSRDS